MLREFSAKRITVFFLIDWLGTLAMLFLAAFLRTQLGQLPPSLVTFLEAFGIYIGWPIAEDISRSTSIILPQVVLLAAIIWPVFFVAFSVYDGRSSETLGTELRRVFLATGVSILVFAGSLFLSYRETSRLVLLVFFVLDLALLLGSRMAVWAYRHSRNGQRIVRRRAVLVIGAGAVGHNAVVQLKKFARADIDLVGYVDDDLDKQGRQFEGLPVLGTLQQVPELVASYSVQDAVVALPLSAYERLVDVCQVLQGLSVRVHVIPDLFALSFPSAKLEGFGGIPAIDLGLPGIYGWQRFSKRAFDLVAASIMLFLFTPILLITAVLIKLGSPGPIIYRQQRVGENGRPFTMFKFRSMQASTDTSVHRDHVARLIQENLSLEQLHNETGQHSLKMQSDPRITGIGRFIRKTSIDEWPQFFNVLRGEMSVVGPRPPLPYEVELYQEWHKRRLEALPGITGWWQVRGRNRVSFDEAVRMDIYYIEHQSFWFDLQILIMTPWALISGRGAG